MKYQNRDGEWGAKPACSREENVGDAIVLYRSDGSSPHPEGSGGQVYHLWRSVYNQGGGLIAEPDRWADGGIPVVGSPAGFKRAHAELDRSLIDPDDTGAGSVEDGVGFQA